MKICTLNSLPYIEADGIRDHIAVVVFTASAAVVVVVVAVVLVFLFVISYTVISICPFILNILIVI